MSPLEDRANAFFDNYTAHIKTGPTLMEATDPEERAARLDAFVSHTVSLFLSKPVAFGMGPPTQWESHEQAKVLLKGLIGRYLELGIGFGGDLKSRETKVWYEYPNAEGEGVHGVVMFDVVWIFKPHEKSGLEPWDMHAFYGWRRTETGEEGFEWGYMDDEMKQLGKRVPNFFEGFAPPS